MYIQHLGHSCFKLQGKDSKGENITIITDPFDKEYGLRVPSSEADIVTVSHNHNDHNNTSAIKGDFYTIDTAGEYEIKDTFIQGIDSAHDDNGGKENGGNIIFRINIEDVVVTHLGDLGHALDNKQIEALQGTDILMVPVGGVYTLDAKKAVEVINQIEPRIIIPMHYQVPGLKFKSGKMIDGVDKFIKEFGVKPTEEEKLKITKKDLPSEDMELVIFK
ncbi:MAG: MBL fold metallo-hydrolase [Patescibacteria group bacterium]|jgi:L-ascorbate metabolism protein UlaG (beta-lactamase superfamily)